MYIEDVLYDNSGKCIQGVHPNGPHDSLKYHLQYDEKNGKIRLRLKNVWNYECAIKDYLLYRSISRTQQE